MTMKTLYETDFYAWAVAQADLIRAGKFEQLDTDNLLTEIEAMGRGERREPRVDEGVFPGGDAHKVLAQETVDPYALAREEKALLDAWIS